MASYTPTSVSQSAPGPVVCAWCKVQLRAGHPQRPVSHGVCAKCAADLLQDHGELTPFPVRVPRDPG